MKKILNSITLSIVLTAIAFSATAQKTGITFSFLNFGYYTNVAPISQGFMGLGFERNAGDYISLKLEVNKGFQLLNKLLSRGGEYSEVSLGSPSTVEVITDSSNNYYTTVDYHWTAPSFDINYQSKFFFTGNDHTGGYIAMGIGMRRITYELHLSEGDEYDDEPAIETLYDNQSYQETFTVIPIMLRLGMRGDLKGFYPDFNFAVGYNIGSGKTITDKTLTKTYDLKTPKPSAFTITGSICFGIGW